MVTIRDMKAALASLGVVEGDILLTHSSFKSLGPCEDGAATVIGGILEALGESGTAVFPTLCQKDWNNVYKNWHLDAESDVGYLTNYFRKLPGARRSNQATHSVAALGAKAEYLTETHGQSGLRYGTYGDTPFAADSPWQKMYELDAKVLFLGVTPRPCTFRHFAEYVLMDEYLKKAEKYPEYAELKAAVWKYETYDEGGIWPHIVSLYVAEVMEGEGKVRHGKCGDAELTLFSSRDYVHTAWRLMRAHDEKVFGDYPKLYSRAANLAWMERIEKLS